MQPGNQAAGAGGRGHLRASHADREHAIEMLKAAYVQGMLAKDELDARVGQALASRTYADLAALSADIPAGLAAAAPERPPAPARRRPLARAAAKSGACLAITAAAVLGGELLIPGDAGPQLWGILMILLAVSSLWTAVGIMGCAVVTSLDQRHSSRQLPPGPGGHGLGGHGLDGQQRGGTGGTGHGPVSPGLRTGRARAGLQDRKPRQHRQHITSQAGRAPRGARPAPGAA